MSQLKPSPEGVVDNVINLSRNELTLVQRKELTEKGYNIVELTSDERCLFFQLMSFPKVPTVEEIERAAGLISSIVKAKFPYTDSYTVRAIVDVAPYLQQPLEEELSSWGILIMYSYLKPVIKDGEVTMKHCGFILK